MSRDHDDLFDTMHSILAENNYVPLGVSELARKTGYPKSTIHKLLHDYGHREKFVKVRGAWTVATGNLEALWPFDDKVIERFNKLEDVEKIRAIISDLHELRNTALAVSTYTEMIETLQQRVIFLKIHGLSLSEKVFGKS